MADEAAIFSAETARQILDTFRRVQASGLIGPSRVESLVKQVPTLHATPIYVDNISGETIPAYGCMHVAGTSEIGGQNFIEVDKPSGSLTGAFLFNGPREIPADEQGVAQSSRVVRAVKTSGTATAGDRWAPVISAWTISTSATGPFIMAGDDDIATNVVRIFVDAGACC